LATVILAIVGFFLIGPVGGVVGILVGVLAPRFLLSFLKKRRVDKFIYQFPDALMTLAAALRAGASLSKGLEQLALRQPPPLSQEFALVVAEHRVGRDLSEALEEMCVRIPRQELELFAAAVGISRGVGGNLADTLDSLAKTLSEKMHIEGKIAALTGSGRSQGWVVSLLPVAVGAVLFKQQPKEMSLLFTEVYGWAVLAIVGIMMTLAVFMIRKIVNIDV
jgi:tight adherence protein B